MAKIQLAFNLHNIGPHFNLNSLENTSSLKTAIYANNGSGKTFLSRMFRLSEVSVDNKINKVNKLISFTKNNGSFEFKIIHNEGIKSIELQLTKGNTPSIKNNTGFIFHTFNSDYVRENIEALEYRPDGEIKGYILGKAHIDLTKEKEALNNKKEIYEVNKKRLEKRVKKQKEELDVKELVIRKNVTEYINFSFENIINQSDLGYPEEKSFQELKKENVTLNTLPDDYPDIQSINFSVNDEIFDLLSSLLMTSYTKSKFSDAFKSKVKSKQNFIELGLGSIQEKDDSCPFCEQTFGDDAIALIDTYIKYLNDEEGKVVKDINDLSISIKNLEKEIKKNYDTYLIIKSKYDELIKYIPSINNEFEVLLEPKVLKDVFCDISDKLIEKKEDITIALDCKGELGTINDYINLIEKNIKLNNKYISDINLKKNNLNKEKLSIKKRLCIAKYQETLELEQESIDELNKQNIDIEVLENEINIEESKVKISKREKIVETFKSYLNIFFNGKYDFDEESFALKMNTHNLIDNASDVLSEGEKSIVAFCFYLAETHKKVDREDDYKKLFFVIDDPISSLDFHYVYSVAQIIKRLNHSFELGERVKFLVLTHNVEFMSILIRNKIVDGRFVIEKQKIQKLQKELIMPYEEHLRDVYNVSKGLVKPNHTTANSIRHILETINKFEKPNLIFVDYCQQIGGLIDENEFLYALIHDNSHGNYRENRPYSEDMITVGCKKVIEIIESKFDGQIEVMKKY
ncbi:MAG: Unknown protein [uncultured Sulfurovum sp.]|uniref:Protein CR006 P-loop domain-containing protein n=1 Tax=uncultured Sulfurovum sp. TaxID=269237 RepID=A0A6S6U8R5_9BACT|nr:MAG: Unknown protein [uncultured Sulfurovum sp.]